jgi:hypothetical protein
VELSPTVHLDLILSNLAVERKKQEQNYTEIGECIRVIHSMEELELLLLAQSEKNQFYLLVQPSRLMVAQEKLFPFP